MKLILSVLIATNLLFGALNRNGEIVSDSTTALQWQDDAIVASTARTWTEAIDYCENTLTLGDHNDWRLPNKKELLSIADRSRYNPSLDMGTFEHVSSRNYWSSTTSAGATGGAWRVYFGYGGSDYSSKTYSSYVRCVRGGQFDDSAPVNSALIMYLLN